VYKKPVAPWPPKARCRPSRVTNEDPGARDGSDEPEAHFVARFHDARLRARAVKSLHRLTQFTRCPAVCSIAELAHRGRVRDWGRGGPTTARQPNKNPEAIRQRLHRRVSIRVWLWQLWISSLLFGGVEGRTHERIRGRRIRIPGQEIDLSEGGNETIKRIVSLHGTAGRGMQ